MLFQGFQGIVLHFVHFSRFSRLVGPISRFSRSRRHPAYCLSLPLIRQIFLTPLFCDFWNGSTTPLERERGVHTMKTYSAKKGIAKIGPIFKSIKNNAIKLL